MFSSDSRYQNVETVNFVHPDGTILAYKKRRFLPSLDVETLLEIAPEQGDRLDQLSAQILGDPLQFWRICDANETLNPYELVIETGRTFRVPKPGF
ncbi:MAG: hypothetical protein ACOYON_02210 [Fimbriimonas sp.]